MTHPSPNLTTQALESTEQLREVGTEGIAAPITWYIVTQVKSDRVIYFTDDPEYHPPTEGDWFYVTPYQGELPKAMRLVNCWRWRLRANQLIDAGQPTALTPAQTLLHNNQKALKGLLNDKIAALLKPTTREAPLSEQVRSLRLAQAQRVLEHLNHGVAVQDESITLITHAAATRAISVQEMAQRTVTAHQAQLDLLVTAEQLRDTIAYQIEVATTQEQLLALRHQIMNDLAPHTNHNYAISPANTTPAQMNGAQPTPEQLGQEQLRLRIQLRLKINTLRKPFVSDYLLDDVIGKHKAVLAQIVVNHPEPQSIAVNQTQLNGQDLMPLISHGAARGQTLLEAAHDVLAERSTSAQALLETEQMKDALLYRIAQAKSFSDIKAIGEHIEHLQIVATP
jgi:hypothetical protein